MTHILLTLLASLVIPATALAIIAGMERSGKESHDELQNSAGGANARPVFKVSMNAKAVVDEAAEVPHYRERAG